MSELSMRAGTSEPGREYKWHSSLWVATREAMRPNNATSGYQSDASGLDLVPDLDQARAFLRLLVGDSPATFQTFPERREGKLGKSPLSARVLHGLFEDHARTLSGLNQVGAGIYVMVNEGDGTVHSGAATCRTSANVVRVRAHMLDLDGAPLDPVLEAGVPPHIVVESSPDRWHVYWLVDECPVDQFTVRQEALNAHFDADASVKDLPRVLRVPGFYNHKRERPFMCRLVAPEVERAH